MKLNLYIMNRFILGLGMAGLLLFSACGGNKQQKDKEQEKIPVILDTDANNELDDQHAIAYLLSNGDIFHVEGITVNATYGGGGIDNHVAEAKRIVRFFERDSLVPVFKGAEKDFEEIVPEMNAGEYDGAPAVNFIIRTAHEHTRDILTVIAVGKLTNIALAVKEDPSLVSRIRLVWLGSNYPEPGEYNLDNDIPAMNYLLKTDIPFEMVVVRGGKSSGTAAVRVTKEEMLRIMPGLGPHLEQPVTGRHGGEFYNFGDYSVDLFNHIDYYDDPPSRALFDVCAVAIVKNPGWADSVSIPCPVMVDHEWQERPDNPRKIILWENFRKDEILSDFFHVLKNYTLVNQPE